MNLAFMLFWNTGNNTAEKTKNFHTHIVMLENKL